MALHDLTVHEAHDLLRQKKVSSTELTRDVLARIKQVEPRVKAYVTVTEGQALADARAADERIARGDIAPLTGIPMQLKDVLNTKGVRTTCSSRMLENYVPIYDATVAVKLKAQGAVLLGKGNMDEFAMGSSTENSAFFTTRNPWDLECVPGGSSGGSAAAVAAGEALFSLGSDTGGSIRQPAALCGVSGIKPTYGRVSRFGLVAFASSLDQVGPFGRDAEDCALVLSAICGHDLNDSTSLPEPVPDFHATLAQGVRGLRIGVPKEYFGEGVDAVVGDAVHAALGELRKLGASVEECSLPLTRFGLPVYYIIAPSECSANLARYDGVKYGLSDQEAPTMWEAMEQARRKGFGPEVRRRVMLGAYALSAGYYDAYYKKAQQVRTLMRQEFAQAFQRYDVLITPTSPTVAFKLGEKTADPVAMYKSDICTLPANMAGLPGMSIPCGFQGGLPIGLQIMGRVLDEATVLRAAYAYQQVTDWHTRRPGL